MTIPGCTRARDLAAEVALGIAGGADREAVLRHCVTCPACRTDLDDLSGTVDSLTSAAPALDPPPGFEDAVMARLANGAPHPAAGRRRRIGSRAPAIAIAAAAALILFVAGLALGRAAGEGSDGRGGVVFDAGRQPVGEVVARPTPAAFTAPDRDRTWVLIVLAPGAPAGDYDVHCTYDEDGVHEDWVVGSMSVRAGEPATFSKTVAFPIDELTTVRLVPRAGQGDLTATAVPQ